MNSTIDYDVTSMSDGQLVCLLDDIARELQRRGHACPGQRVQVHGTDTGYDEMTGTVVKLFMVGVDERRIRPDAEVRLDDTGETWCIPGEVAPFATRNLRLIPRSEG